MKKDFVYLKHVLDSIDKILTCVEASEEEFYADFKLHDTVLRNFEVIGEATKNISEQLRISNGHIPWKLMAGMRDKLIHQYFGVDLKIVWKTAKEDLPFLRASLEKLLNQEA